MWRNLLPSDNFRRLFYFLSFKPTSFVQWVVEEENFSENRTTSASHVRWVVKEKSFRFLRPNRHLVSVGYWREKSFRTFWPNTIFVKGVLEKNFQKFLAKQPISLQWILGEKSFRFFWPNGDFCPVGTEERKLQNLSFKTGKTLQWVVERRNFRKPSVLALRWGYQMRERNFSSKTLDQNGPSWPVGSEGKIFLRKSGPLGRFSSSGYWGRDEALRKGWLQICTKSCHRN